MHNKKHKKLRTFAILFAIATLIIHIVNKAIIISASFKEMLDIINRKFFHSKFGDIYYTKHGKGTPVLLIHDALPGSSGYEWNRIEKLIATEHTVYTIDLLGYGRSEKPGITYTNYLYVQLIEEFIEKVIGTKTDVIVSGYSGSFVLMANANNKELFNKIMLINPPSIESLNKEITLKEQILDVALKIPVFGTLLYHMFVSRETINNLFSEKLYHNPLHVDKDITDAYYESAHKGGYYVKYLYSSFASGKMNVNLSHGIASLDNNVLIIEGESEIKGNSIIESYTELNPSITAEIIKCAKHYPQIENPEAVLEQIGLFL